MHSRSSNHSPIRQIRSSQHRRMLFFALAGICLPRGAAAGSPPTPDPSFGLRPSISRVAPPARPDAQWIWANNVRDQQTIYLRGVFSLVSAPKRAGIFITADNFFTLWVNGREVDSSHPIPGDDLVWRHVHHDDLTALLRPGTNVIAIKALNTGGAASVVARVEVDGRPVLLTSNMWRVLDASTPPTNWDQPAFNSTSWPTATVEAPLAGGPWNSSTGIEGWPGLIAGSAPYLAHLPIRAAQVLDVHPGDGSIDGAGTLAGTGTPHVSVRFAPPESKDLPNLVLDFGKELSGRVEIVTDEDSVVLVGTGESREEAIKSPWGGVHRLELVAGKMGATPYSAFRYALLRFSPASPTQKTVTISKALCDFDYYPVVYRGAFDCSDNLLTKIWYTGAYTAHLCMQEDIWDAPKRDRARWMGDLHVSGEVINTVFLDTFLMEQTMQRLRDDAQGGGPQTGAPHSHVNGIPGYSCAWISGLADFYRHTGDHAYLMKQHDLLLSLLDYFKGELDDRGIFANKRGQWPFVDWSPDFNADGPLARAATHMFLVKAVRESVFLLREMGDEANADRMNRWADELQTAARQYLLDPADNTYGNRRQENAMAIVSGVATPGQERQIYDLVLKPGSPDWATMATPYYDNYVIYAMSIAGHTRSTLDFIRSFWGGMIAEGATSFWEGYDPTWQKDDFHAHLQADNGTGYFVSLCHGWSSGPTSWLTERVLGVTPTGGGFKTAVIEPDLGGLDWASGTIPTPHGGIRLRVEQSAQGLLVHLTLPAGIDATVSLPGSSARVNGKLVVGTPAPADRKSFHLRHRGEYTIAASTGRS